MGYYLVGNVVATNTAVRGEWKIIYYKKYTEWPTPYHSQNKININNYQM